MVSTAATFPAGPARPSGLSIPISSKRPRGQRPGDDGQDRPGHAGGHDQPPAARPQPAVGQEQRREKNA
jgi:hypothetical protein